MYRLLFRKIGTETWQEGTMFSDEALTPDAREILADRYARNGLETRLVRVNENEVVDDEKR